MDSRDRRALVLNSTAYNGIDFVAIVNTAQTVLVAHFLNAVNVQGTLTGSPVISGGETIPTVPVLPINPGDWGWDDGHAVLTLRVAAPGDFSNYTLTLASPVLDQFFSQITFSFKAGCPSDLDCETPPAPCPPATGAAPPINYLAKDFLSFRQALLDFSTTQYANWQERSEADFGMMFLEAISAIGDELSYTQDRIAGEATLLTATQRRSAVRHARLVDYEPMPAVGAQTWLQFEVADTTIAIPKATAAIAPGADGTPITFETGLGLGDPVVSQPASALWNRAAGIQAYWFDDSTQCLPAAATSMYVLGQGYGFQPGQMLLIETAPQNAADPPLRQIVHLLQAGDAAGPWTADVCDPLLLGTVTGLGPPFLTCPTSPPAAPERPQPRADGGARPVADHRHRQHRLRHAGPHHQGRGVRGRRAAAGQPQPDPGHHRAHRAATAAVAGRVRRSAGDPAIHARQRAADLAATAVAGPQPGTAAGDHAQSGAHYARGGGGAVELGPPAAAGGRIRSELHHRSGFVPHDRAQLRRLHAKRL